MNVLEELFFHFPDTYFIIRSVLYYNNNNNNNNNNNTYYFLCKEIATEAFFCSVFYRKEKGIFQVILF
jgi:hypothetical protein